MITTNRLPIFDQFVADLRAIWITESEIRDRMLKSKPLLERLVCSTVLREHAKTWPSTDVPSSNLLLHEDPDFGFVINAVVRTAGRTGKAHDHAHAWVLYGVLDGHESLERFDRLDDASTPGRAEIELSSVTIGEPGNVDLVEPFAIHAEQGGPERSVAVILRSVRTVGPVQQRYDREAKTVAFGSSPLQIPFELTTDI